MNIVKTIEQSFSFLAATAALLGGLAGCGGVSPETGGTSGGGSGGEASSSGAGGLTGSGGATGSGGSTGATVEIGAVPVGLDVAASRVLADPVHKTFLALVGEKAAAHANSLVVVDAATGGVLSSTEVGKDPSTMALSDDGSTLWVGFSGVSTVRRVDLSAGAPVPGDSYSVPQIASGGVLFAGEMAVLPGTKDSVAVALRKGGVGAGAFTTVVMDGGVWRPKSTGSFAGAVHLTAGPEGWLFGGGSDSTSLFYSIQITPDGLTNVVDDQGLIFGHGGEQLVYSGGRVYTAAAAVLDVSDPKKPMKAGNFAYAGQSLHLVPSKERAVLLSLEKPAPGATEITLRYLDTSTFWLADGKTFANVEADEVRDLVSPDEQVFGFVAESDSEGPRLYLVQNSFSE